jgi:hypothetical protein
LLPIAVKNQLRGKEGALKLCPDYIGVMQELYVSNIVFQGMELISVDEITQLLRKG